MNIRLVWLIGCVWLLHTSSFAQGPDKIAYDKAIAFMNKGKVKKGFKLLDKALSHNPAHYDARYARAYYNFNEGYYESAIQDYNAILTQYPKDTTIYRYRGLAHLYTGDFMAAENDLLHALALDSSDSGTFGELGYLYYQWNDLEQAKFYFDKSISRQPNAYAYYHKAQAHYLLGEYEEALKAIAQNLVLNAKDEEAIRLKALIFLNTKKYTEAIKIYEQLLASGSLEEPDDLFNWGLAYYLQKKYPEALTYFTTPRKHNDADLYYYTGLTHFKLKNHKAALKEMDKAVMLINPRDEEYAPVFYNRAIVKNALNDQKGALKDYFQSVFLIPEIVAQKGVDGDTLELIGNAGLLLKGFYSKKQIDSVSAIGYRERADAMFGVDGSEKEALTTIEKAIALDPSDAKSYFIRASIQYFFESYAEVLKDINKAIQLSKGKEQEQYYYLRGLVFYEMNFFEKSHQDISKAILLHPANASYYYDRAYASAGLEQFTEAIADINQVLRLDQADSATYLLARAGFYMQENQFTNALADCNSALAIDADNAMAYYQRGLAYQELRKYYEAVADFNKALQLEPDFPEANEALREALLKVEK